MKDLEKAREALQTAERVLLPDRYLESFVEEYQAVTGREVPIKDGRKASRRSDGVDFRWQRGRDIPKTVLLCQQQQPDVQTVGLTGSEWCVEFNCGQWNARNAEWLKLGEDVLGTVSLIALSRISETVEGRLSSRRPRLIDVVTSFPAFVTALGMSDQCNLEAAVPMTGGVEGVADMLNMPAVDLVSPQARTINACGFVMIKSLLPAYVAVVTGAR